MKPRKFLQTAVCASLLAVGAASPAAWAQRPPPHPQEQNWQSPAPPPQAHDGQRRASPSRMQHQAQSLLSIREVYDLLEQQGYRNFTEFELERRRRGQDEYDVKADNADGNYVKLEVDAYTGRVLSERRKRD